MRGQSLYEIIFDSIGRDTALADPDRESPNDVKAVGSSRMENSEEVHAALERTTKRLLDTVQGIEDPGEFYPTLMAEVPGILEDESIPESVRDTLRKLVDNAIADIGRIYEYEERITDEEPAHVAGRVMRDIHHIAWIPLKDEELLKSIGVEEVDASEVAELLEVIPQLEHLNENRGLKGGAARLALKVYVYKNLALRGKEEEAAELLETIKAELPLSDLDIVMSEDERDPEGFAKQMGVHPIDIESIFSFRDASLTDHFGRRDTASNQVALTGGEDGKLYFSSLAKEDLSTNPGLARSVVSTIPGLYRTESITVHDRRYFSSNTFYRLVKMIADGKHKYFEAQKFNLDAIKMGPYGLVIASKCMRKEKGAEIFAKVHSCALQMGETQAATPAEYLTELMETYDDFNFKGQTLIDGVRWMVGNYIDFIKRVLLRKHKIRPDREDIFTSEDEELVRIEPDVSGVDEAQLAEVQAIFDSIMTDIGEEGDDVKKDGVIEFGASEEQIQSFLAKLEAGRQERIDAVDTNIEAMRERGPQSRDKMMFREHRYDEGALAIDRVIGEHDGYIYIYADWDHLRIPRDAFVDVEYYSGQTSATTDLTVWKLCEGVEPEKVDFMEYYRLERENGWRDR